MARTLAVFTRSLVPTVRFVVTSAVLAVACAVIAIGTFRSGALVGEVEMVAFVAMLVFGICVIGGVLRIMRFKPVLDVTTEGIRDRRIAPEIIPWSGIASVTVSDARRHRTLELKVHSNVADRLMRPRGSATVRRDLAISMAGLSGSFDDLVSALKKAEEATRGQRRA